MTRPSTDVYRSAARIATEKFIERDWLKVVGGLATSSIYERSVPPGELFDQPHMDAHTHGICKGPNGEATEGDRSSVWALSRMPESYPSNGSIGGLVFKAGAELRGFASPGLRRHYCILQKGLTRRSLSRRLEMLFLPKIGSPEQDAESLKTAVQR